MKYITQDWTSTKDGYLFLFKEIKSSLMTDVIVRELYKYEVIEEMAKFLDKDQRTAVHYIFN